MIRRLLSVVIPGVLVVTLTTSGYSDEPEMLRTPPTKVIPCGPSKCGESGAQRIILECSPPEIVIQRAGGACAPEPKTFLQKCGHFRMHQWTHMSYPMHHSHGQVTGIPMAVAPQAYMMPQTYVAPQSYVMPQAFVAPQSFVAPQAYVAPQSYVMPQSFVAPQAFLSPQSFVAPQSFVSPQSFTITPQASVAPQASVTPQAGDSDKMEIKEAVRKLSENLKVASELLKFQAQILQKHDEAIDSLRSDLDATKKLLEPLKGYNLSVVDGAVKATKK